MCYNVKTTNYEYTIFTIHMDRTHDCFRFRFRYSIDFLFIKKDERKTIQTHGLGYDLFNDVLNQKKKRKKKTNKNCALFYQWMCVIETNTRLSIKLAESLSHFVHQKFVFLLFKRFWWFQFICSYVFLSCLWLSSYYLLTHSRWLFQQNVFSTLKHKPNSIGNISQ